MLIISVYSKIKWSFEYLDHDNEGIITVSKKGELKALKPGTSKIKVTATSTAYPKYSNSVEMEVEVANPEHIAVTDGMVSQEITITGEHSDIDNDVHNTIGLKVLVCGLALL